MPRSQQGSPGPGYLPTCWLLAFALFTALAGPTAAQDAGEGRDLYLEVFVNGQPKNLVARITDLGDGVLSADAEELRNSGILPDSVTTRGELRLGDIPGLGWRLIESEQVIRFIVPEGLLAPKVISAGPAERDPFAAEEDAAPVIDHGYGLVLNYGLNLDSWRTAAGETGQSASGSFDSRLFMPMGTFSHGFVLVDDDAGKLSYRRLDSYWRSAFPGRAVQVQLGDIATRGPGWSRPVRLGGLMVERNFGLRPDLLTLPLPGFEGNAALPSTVEVFTNSIRNYSGDVPAGPFRIDDLPIASGSGMARVVVRDVTGRETQIDMPFLVSDALLRPGMADFALSAGRPRLSFGLEGDGYGDDIYGVATLRYGLSQGLTVTAHAEGGPGLTMGGLGVTSRVAHLGTASLSFAHSRADRGEGWLLDLSTELEFGRTRMSGRILRSGGQFSDIAAVTADADLTSSEFPNRIAQLSISRSLGNARDGSASLFLSDLRQADMTSETSLGITYTRQVLGDASLALTAVAQRGAEDDQLVGLQLHMPLGGRRSASVYAEHRREGWRQSMNISGRSKSGVPGWDWRLQATRNDSLSVLGRAAYENRLGRAEVGASTSNGHRSLGLRLDGAVVVAGGGLFLSRSIDDSFAVVDAGAPGVEVSAENRPVGRTGRSGKILVPDLRAYEPNNLSINPEGLPLDAAVGATRKSVRPAHRAGALVSFGVEASAHEALIALVDADGQPLQVGGKVVLNGLDQELLVGFDGEVFALGLQARNEIVVSYGGGRGCSAQFPYTDEPGILTEIRGVPCL
ncbi:fimbria/pilus outer membrane usher protein [Paracoccus seriniphilus]|uniref:Outer membrane usher protein n=1 Tax=Paracoccus seriniphilus TaxID=184748 RepID=A0A239Q1C8_9RHOB|nr:fimbria/pilus outer membrane usher protein [Paracoccus seriniphilus]WCR15811.1 fimbrial biogenesis outer membrane usher protein [Paracoccus seriniphilus]SNT76138.1 outer membrane usher protein [Paracoccus seriniphilus]